MQPRISENLFDLPQAGPEGFLYHPAFVTLEEEAALLHEIAVLPLRQRFGAWADIAPEQFVQALVSEYRPGTPLGWHRDMPDYEAIVGVSLGTTCRMRFRPYRPDGPFRKTDVLALDLPPRSAYQMRGPARWAWQHCVAPTEGLRYSITFRTARGREARGVRREA